MKRTKKNMPDIGVHPERTLTPSELKSAATNAAATAIIDGIAAERVAKSNRLKALRLQQEADTPEIPKKKPAKAKIKKPVKK